MGRYNRPAEYDVVVQKDIMVPMRDDIRLATDIYFPAKNAVPAEGKFPTILVRTPYDKKSRLEFNHEDFVTRGYVFIIQDVRGRYASEGEFYIYVNEGIDGYDTVEWIAKQPWSDGIVGTAGWSYMGTDQNAMAREKPPHLKAMFVAFGSSNYHQDVGGTNGAFKLSHNLTYTINLARADRNVRTDPKLDAWLAECQENIWSWFKKPLSKHIAIFKDVPMAERWYRDWVEHQDHDDYWKQNGFNVEDFFDRYPDIPIYNLGGWFYHSFRSAIRSYEELSNIHRSPIFLMLGPWPEGPSCDLLGLKTWHGDVDFGMGVVTYWNEIRLRFFDQFLKGIETGILDEPPVKIFVMGGGDGRKIGYYGKMNHGGRWRTSKAWPLPQTKFTKYYMHKNGTLNPEIPPPNSPPSKYSFDPAHPIPQIGGSFTFPFSAETMGPYDQKCSKDIPGCDDSLPLSSRSDILVFATPPLKTDLEIIGPLTVKLWASSTAVDTDFTAKLIDVYPPNVDYPYGYAMYLVDSILRARYRYSYEIQKLMTKGQIYEFNINLWATSNLFKEGHKIRLDISSSNFPLFDVNPNTGEKIGCHTKTVVAENTIYHDLTHPSHIILPVVS